MSLIIDDVLYSRTPHEEVRVDVSSYENFGEFVLSFLHDDVIELEAPWLINAGYDMTGSNRATCGTISRAYADIEPMSRAIGKQLAELGVGNGSTIQMFVPNNTDYHAVVIGTWLCRGVVSLSDPTLGVNTLCQQLVDTSATVIVCCEKTRGTVLSATKEAKLQIEKVVQLGDTKMTALKILRKSEQIENVSVSEKFDLDETLVIFWSSGTTGKPKGILHSGRYLASVMVRGGWSIKLDDVIITTCFFHVGGFLTPLLLLNKRPASCAHFFVGEDVDTSVDLILRACDKYTKNNGLLCGSHHLAMMTVMKTPLREDGQCLNLSRIFLAMAMGTKPPADISHELRKKFPNLRVVPNFYGFTEVGTTVTCSMDPRAIGFVCPGVAVKIVDPISDTTLGPNQIGELLVKSSTVMKGYLNRPKENEKFFADDGFVRSGDLARYDEKGILYFEGRLKELIKIRSRHLYPIEIERIIDEHPDVIESAVVGVPDRFEQELVTAAVVLIPNSDLSANDIQKYVEERLENHKWLRGGVYFVDKLPRNPQGKIQRHRLREIFLKRTF